MTNLPTSEGLICSDCPSEFLTAITVTLTATDLRAHLFVCPFGHATGGRPAKVQAWTCSPDCLTKYETTNGGPS